MSSSVIRCEMHALATTPAARSDVARTIAAYRRLVRGLCGVLMVHWPEIAGATSKCQAVEALFHATSKRPVVRYVVLDRMLGKMPSYLRRAAIEHALGAVASFLTNWDQWIDGQVGGKQRAVGARAPRLGLASAYPSLYGGNMVRYGRGLRTVQIKLLGANGQWRFSAPFHVKGRFKRINPVTAKMELCPSLIMRGAKVSLACPAETRPPPYVADDAFASHNHRVCSIDLGINTAATAAIVDSTGTVIARRFLTCGRHNARRDALAGVIASKQSFSGGVSRGERHCVVLHRRVQGLNLDAARELASAVAAFAAEYGAKAVVIEDLKGWRPKGSSPAMRRRFVRFQHRALVRALVHQSVEMGARLVEVSAGGTSRWAYDGSGKVTRSATNAQLATFASGKQYNADLNGALNIAARGLAMLMGIQPKRLQALAGKSSGGATRMPLVLADVWAHAQTSRGTSHQPAAPAGV